MIQLREGKNDVRKEGNIKMSKIFNSSKDLMNFLHFSLIFYELH
jgi:hypothetical protein